MTPRSFIVRSLTIVFLFVQPPPLIVGILWNRDNRHRKNGYHDTSSAVHSQTQNRLRTTTVLLRHEILSMMNRNGDGTISCNTVKAIGPVASVGWMLYPGAEDSQTETDQRYTQYATQFLAVNHVQYNSPLGRVSCT
jgi:hypothetical protein